MAALAARVFHPITIPMLMSRLALRTPVFLTTALSLLFGANDLVMADQPIFDPITFIFTAGNQRALLKLFNGEDREITWTIRPFSWDHDQSGVDSFAATDDITTSSSQVTLRAHSGDAVEVAARGSPEINKEIAYRIMLQSSSNSRDGVNVAYRFSIPVFVKSGQTIRSRAVKIASREQGQVEITIVNDGNTHEFLKSLTVSGNDERGRKTFAVQQNGWYLLPCHGRTYVLKLSSKDCRSAARLTVKAVFREGPEESVSESWERNCPPDAPDTEFIQGPTQMRSSNEIPQ